MLRQQMADIKDACQKAGWEKVKAMQNAEKQGKDQDAEDDTDLEEDDNIEENPGVEEDDLEVDVPEDDDWEEKETQRKGFFHRKPKEKVEEEPDDVEENDTENEVGVSKIHKVRAGLFGRGMSDDLDDEDWEEDEDFLPVERKKTEENMTNLTIR